MQEYKHRKGQDTNTLWTTLKWTGLLTVYICSTKWRLICLCLLPPLYKSSSSTGAGRGTEYWFSQAGQRARLESSRVVLCHSFIIHLYDCRFLWHNGTCFISWKLLRDAQKCPARRVPVSRKGHTHSSSLVPKSRDPSAEQAGKHNRISANRTSPHLPAVESLPQVNNVGHIHQSVYAVNG